MVIGELISNHSRSVPRALYARARPRVSHGLVVGPLHGRHSGRRYNAISLPRPEPAGHRRPPLPAVTWALLPVPPVVPRPGRRRVVSPWSWP